MIFYITFIKIILKPAHVWIYSSFFSKKNTYHSKVTCQGKEELIFKLQKVGIYEVFVEDLPSPGLDESRVYQATVENYLLPIT